MTEFDAKGRGVHTARTRLEAFKGKKAKEKITIRGYYLYRSAACGQLAGNSQAKCVCGYKIRGPNHEEGTHHKMLHPSLRRVNK